MLVPAFALGAVRTGKPVACGGVSLGDKFTGRAKSYADLFPQSRKMHNFFRIQIKREKTPLVWRGESVRFFMR
jgi:hypothetical protein